MFGKHVATPSPREVAPLSPYEDGPSGKSQWWTDDGIYFGYQTTPPEDDAHVLRSTWRLTGDTVHYREDRHVMTIGPNGSGKTRRLLFPNLYFLKNWSIVAIDPKGELFAHTARERAKSPDHKVVLVDPFSVVKRTYPKLVDEKFPCDSAGFNPIAALDPTSDRFVDDAKSLAVALIKSETHHERYWTDAAQALVKGLILFLRVKAGEDASLVDLRNMLGRTPPQLAEDILLAIEEYGEDWPAIAASLSEFSYFSSDDRELGSIRRMAKVQTDWLDSKEMRADVERDVFDFATLKETPTTVYLVLPPEFLATHGMWLRMMVASILRPLLRSVTRPKVPVLFMLDEFAQLGRMEIIEDNYALMRGYGVKLWTIWQDLNQAKNLYAQRWESFISNSGIVQAFAPQDMTTRQYLSQLADKRMTWHRREGGSGSVSFGKGSASVQSGGSQSDHHIIEPIMYPYELGQMGQGQSVVFTQRGAVIRRYFPDATQMPGVADMMAEAAKVCD